MQESGLARRLAARCMDFEAQRKMVLTAKLLLRQSQSLVMTPQLLQAIKLLQFSNVELSAFIEQELERNPLLERAEELAEPAPQPEESPPAADIPQGKDLANGAEGEEIERDWQWERLATNRVDLEASLGTELSNSFDEGFPASVSERSIADPSGLALSLGSWFEEGGGNGDPDAPGFEAYASEKISLKNHLETQLTLAISDPASRLIGQMLIDCIDENGYFSGSLDDTAERLEAPREQAEEILRIIQSFDPTGVGARSLSECLSIQLRERDRLDPAMRAMIGNLDLVARRDIAALRKLCNVDEEDVLDMLAEIRRLDPKPGRALGDGAIEPILPDVLVRALPAGGWQVELNTAVLPRILVNNSYVSVIAKAKASESERTFISTCRQNATWLTKSLEQRARTILKVSSEIVRHQDAFFERGIQHLRPLDLKTIAEAVGVHESTVSRVTSNKYMSTPRGLFELKYFFTASIAAHDGGDAHSAESVRFRIKQMIDQESPSRILSDDAIAAQLKVANIDIARRTVAKYRESLKIGSSVERRRQKSKK